MRVTFLVFYALIFQFFCVFVKLSSPFNGVDKIKFRNPVSNTLCENEQSIDKIKPKLTINSTRNLKSNLKTINSILEHLCIFAKSKFYACIFR